MSRLAVINSEESVREIRLIIAETRPLLTLFRETTVAANALNQSLRSGNLRDYTNSVQGATQATREYVNTGEQLSAAQRRLIQVERQLAIAQSEQRQQIQDVMAQTRQLTAAQRERANLETRLAALSENERQRLGNTLQIYNAVQKRMNTLQLEYRNLALAKELGMRLTDQEKARFEQLQKQIQRYDNALKAVDASMGNHRRNVGNYTGGFNSLNNSVAQIAREMPAFTYSVQTGLLAISNNLPIFFDAVTQARAANAALRAEGKTTVPIWKQLTSSVLSWNIALSVGVTLLTVYGAKIYETVKQMIKSKTATDVLKESQEELNKQMASGASQAIVKYKELQAEWNNLTGSFSQKQKFLKDNADKFHELGVEVNTVSQAEKLFADGTSSFIEVLMLRAEAAANAQLAVETYKKALIDQKKEEKDFSVGGWKSGVNTVLGGTLGWRPFKSLGPQNSDAEFDAADTFIKKEQELLKKAEALQKKIGINPYTKPDKKQGADKLSADQKNYLMRLEAAMNEELAVNETRFTNGEVKQREYLKKIESITVGFNNKKIAYLRGSNAKEAQEVAKAELDKAKIIRDTNDKFFDLDSKELEENNKIKLSQSERYFTQLEENQYLSDYDRLTAQIKYYDDLYTYQENYYKDILALAEKYNLPDSKILTIERERDQDLGKIQDDRLKKQSDIYDAAIKDLQTQTEIAKVSKEISYEQQKRLILNNKKLSLDERNRQLLILEKQNQIDINKKEIERLEVLKKQLLYKRTINGTPLILSPEDLKTYNELVAAQEKLKNENIVIDLELKEDISDNIKEIRSNITKGFSDLGFEGLAEAYSLTMDRLKDKTASWKDYAVLAAAAVLDALSQLNNKQKEQTIAALDEQLKHSKEVSDQEIEFINSRLEHLNGLDELSKEQIDERNKLEDEARGMREQQAQREKLIEAQKARAEQKAAAQQALINGALAATSTLAKLGIPAGLVPAAIALAFGVAQSIAINSKNPVPQYWKGRTDGPAELAWTQERGREIIADKHGNIKDLGSDSGAKITWLEKGDKVITAPQTKSYISRLKELREIPKIGSNIFKKVAMNSLQSPSVNLVINKNEDYSQKIIDGLSQKIISGFGKEIQRNTNPNIQKINGFLIEFNGSKIPITKGTYDLKTGEETWYQ